MFYDVVGKNIEVAISTIDQLTDNSMHGEMDNDISTGVINAVHSINDYNERIDKKLLNNDEDLLFKAFSYLNNQIKHDKSLEFIHFPVYGSTFPVGYPMRFGNPGVSWENFTDNGRTTSRGKREHFEECLCGKDIVYTLSIIMKIIEITEYKKQSESNT